MRAATAIRDLWQAVDRDRAMGLVEAVSRCDRYQASRGIEDAAGLVAEAAERAGLAQVMVHHVDVASAPGWWTFAPPAPWTPRSATLRLLAAGEPAMVLRYPARPYGLAANSAPTPHGGITATVQRESDLGPAGPAPGSVVLLDRCPAPAPATLRLLAASEVAAWIGCPTWEARRTPAGASGRLELPAGSALRAFSISSEEFARVRSLPDPLTAVIDVQAEASGRMPLVTGVLAPAGPGAGGGGGGEILLQAHLCHPAPGADDNAAGVAALAEAATALGRLPPLRRQVRFLWAPEFAGTAAYLHDLVTHGPLPLPTAVVNLDLVGGQPREVGPIVVDPTPDHVGGPTTAVAEHCLDLLPADRRSYSGAEGIHDRGWTTVGHTGASDHVLFADRSVAVPAVQLGHMPGPRHHTSADTVAHVDPEEIRRVTVAAAATAAVLADAGRADADGLARLVVRSTWRRLLRVAHQIDARDDAGQSAGVVDPWAQAVRAALCGHLVAAARTDLQAVGELTGGGSAVAAADRLERAARDVLGTGTGAVPGTSAVPGAGPLLRPAWPGPFNLRAALAAVATTARDALESWLHDDRVGAYTAMTAVAHALDGHTPAGDVLRRAAFGTGLRIPEQRARTFLDALAAAGWAVEAP